MQYSDKKTLTIDIDRDTEFVGDDADQFSDLICLDKPYEYLLINPQTITSSALNLYIQEDDAIATVPQLFHHGQVTGATPAWGTAAWTTTGSTGNYYILVHVGKIQFFRIRATTNQTTTDKTLYAWGVNP